MTTQHCNNLSSALPRSLTCISTPHASTAHHWTVVVAGEEEDMVEVVRWLRQEKETSRQEVHLVQQEAARLRQDCLRYQREAATAAAEVRLSHCSVTV